MAQGLSLLWNAVLGVRRVAGLACDTFDRGLRGVGLLGLFRSRQKRRYGEEHQRG